MFRSSRSKFMPFYLPDDGSGGGNNNGSGDGGAGSGEGGNNQPDTVSKTEYENLKRSLDKANSEAAAFKRELKSIKDKSLSDEEKNAQYLAELETKNKAYEAEIIQGKAKVALTGSGYNDADINAIMDNIGDPITLAAELSKIKKASDKMHTDKITELEKKILVYQNDPAAGRGEPIDKNPFNAIKQKYNKKQGE